jgi:hypothetical protein
MNTPKVVRDGMVAVLVSPGYGAGWSTWSSKPQEMMFNPEMVYAVETEAGPFELEWLSMQIFPDQYTGGASTLTIEWVPEGTEFYISDHDGFERLNFVSGPDSVTA